MSVARAANSAADDMWQNPPHDPPHPNGAMKSLLQKGLLQQNGKKSNRVRFAPNRCVKRNLRKRSLSPSARAWNARVRRCAVANPKFP